MNEIKIKNQQILDILNESLFFYHNRDDIKLIKPNCSEDDQEKFISDDYMRIIVDQHEAHNGYPKSLKGYSLDGSDTYLYTRPEDKQKRLPIEWLDKYSNINEKLMHELSVRNNAVASLYPPDGYISWHNNANATGFNLIFTWSETGDGWFDYIEDNGKGERVRCQDKKGEWVCRYGMFGSYHQDEYPIVYHAASSNGGWRITLAYIFSASEAAGGLQDFIIEELANP